MAKTSYNYAEAHTCLFEVFEEAAGMPDMRLVMLLFNFAPIRHLCAIHTMAPYN